MESTQNQQFQIKPNQNASTQSKHNKTTQAKTKQVKHIITHVKAFKFETQQNNTNQHTSKRSTQIE